MLANNPLTPQHFSINCSGKLDDLQVGANIIVRGESDANGVVNGVVNAVSIQLADSVPAPLP